MTHFRRSCSAIRPIVDDVEHRICSTPDEHHTQGATQSSPNQRRPFRAVDINSRQQIIDDYFSNPHPRRPLNRQNILRCTDLNVPYVSKTAKKTSDSIGAIRLSTLQVDGKRDSSRDENETPLGRNGITTTREGLIPPSPSPSKSSPRLRGPRAILLSRIDRPQHPRQGPCISLPSSLRQDPSEEVQEHETGGCQDVLPTPRRKPSSVIPLKRHVARQSWSQFLRQRDGMDIDDDEGRDLGPSFVLSRNPALFPRAGDLKKLRTYHKNPNSLRADWDLGDKSLVQIRKVLYEFEMKMRMCRGEEFGEVKAYSTDTTDLTGSIQSPSSPGLNGSSMSEERVSLPSTATTPFDQNMADLAKLRTRGGIRFVEDRDLLRPVANASIIPQQYSPFDINQYSRTGHSISPLLDAEADPSNLAPSRRDPQWLMRRAQDARAAWATRAGVKLNDPAPIDSGSSNQTEPVADESIWELDWDTRWEILRMLLGDKESDISGRATSGAFASSDTITDRTTEVQIALD